MLEVSPLLRELVLQMDIGMDGARTLPDAELLARERRLGALALDELRRAAPVRLGIELPQDKRLRALCEAVLADPARHATLEGWAARSRRQHAHRGAPVPPGARHLLRPVAPAGAAGARADAGGARHADGR